MPIQDRSLMYIIHQLMYVILIVVVFFILVMVVRVVCCDFSTFYRDLSTFFAIYAFLLWCKKCCDGRTLEAKNRWIFGFEPKMQNLQPYTASKNYGLTDSLLYVLMIDPTKDRRSSSLERTLVCRRGRENLIKTRYQLCLLLVLSVLTIGFHTEQTLFKGRVLCILP